MRGYGLIAAMSARRPLPKTTAATSQALGVSSSEWREGVQEFGAFAMLRHALGVYKGRHRVCSKFPAC